MGATPTFVLSKGKFTMSLLSYRCDKKYLYQSSLKKHYLVCHKELYEKAVKDSNSKSLIANPTVKSVGYNEQKAVNDVPQPKNNYYGSELFQKLSASMNESKLKNGAPQNFSMPD